MNRNKLVLVSLAGMLMLAQSLFAQKSGVTYSIGFDGYCDGATVTVGANGFVTGTHDNFDCAGSQTWLDGITSLPVSKFANMEGIGPISLADNVGVLAIGNAALTLYLNFKTGVWSFYLESDGVLPEQILNIGTFSLVRPEATSSSKSASWQKHAAIVTQPFFSVSGYPTGSYELVLYDRTHHIEYCDYFELMASGDRVGGLHNYMTGCAEASNAPAGGNYTFLGQGVIVMGNAQGAPFGVAGGRGLLTTDNSPEIIGGENITLNYYFNFQSGLWSLYATDGTTGLEVLNWGTFSVVQANPLTGKQRTHPVGGPLSNSRQTH